MSDADQMVPAQSPDAGALPGAIDRGWIKLPMAKTNAIRQLQLRVLAALGVLGAAVLLVMADHNGYNDNSDGTVDWLDALYYATVTLSTTGYGDITPVSDTARLMNVLIITPLRIAFLAILVGTTFQVLTRSYRDQVRRERWRAKLRDHTVVVGYGTKGNNAIRQLIASGSLPTEFVIVDNKQENVDEANRDGFAAILGDATRAAVLRKASVPTAKRVIISTNRDDAAVLTTLTARQLNATCLVVTAVREAENEALLLRSGANAVVTSSAAAGRLLGVAAVSPKVGEVFTDLLVHGDGLELFERDVQPDEIGKPPAISPEPIISVLRGGTIFTYKEIDTLRAGDRVVTVCAQPRKRPDSRSGTA